MNDFEPMTGPDQYPDKFTPEDLAIAVRNEVAELVIDDTQGKHEVRFKNGPSYDAQTGEKLAFTNNAPDTEGFVTDETKALDVEEVPEEVQDIPGDDVPDADEEEIDEDAFDDDQPEEIEAEADFLEQLDAVDIPPAVTEEDLAAAGLGDGPDFTHSEALLATLAAANAASPEFEVEPDLGEALYEFGAREGWMAPETFYIHACFLAETPQGTFSEIDQEMKIWFTVFARTGEALHTYAASRKRWYVDAMNGLAREIDKTRLRQKLADRRAVKLKKRKKTSDLRRRAAAKWKKKRASREG
jgi:hypothetical protein